MSNNPFGHEHVLQRNAARNFQKLGRGTRFGQSEGFFDLRRVDQVTDTGLKCQSPSHNHNFLALCIPRNCHIIV